MMDDIVRFYEQNKINYDAYRIYKNRVDHEKSIATKIINKNKKNNKFMKLCNNVLQMLNSTYVIFLTNKYFSWFNRLLLKYFSKYNIIFFNYNDKDEILNILDIINYFIKHETPDNKNRLKIKLKIKHMRMIYFLENNIEPEILYKKISFSQEEIFLSFDNYMFKKMEYKLKTFCQIAEKLGAKTIKIKYDSNFESVEQLNFSMGGGEAEIEASKKEVTKNEENIGLTFKYSNFNHNITLNKFYLLDLIEKENELFISNEEFNSDIDLKFLIDSRCLNLIELYNTRIMINRYNEIERKICAKAKSYKLNLETTTIKNEHININIFVEFVNIYENPDSITGSNLYVLKEGFWHLNNIIKVQTTQINEKNTLKVEDSAHIELYYKVYQFLKIHLRYIDKKIIKLNKSYKFFQNCEEIFTHIFNPNFFNRTEINELFYDFFNNNMFFYSLERFRNILLNIINIDEIIFTERNKFNKFYFIAYQYNNVSFKNNTLIDTLNQYFEKIYQNIILSENNELLQLIKDLLNISDITELLNNNNLEYKNIIKNNIVNAFTNSYIVSYGLIDEYDMRLYDDTLRIINTNFDNKFKTIIDYLNNKINLCTHSNILTIIQNINKINDLNNKSKESISIIILNFIIETFVKEMVLIIEKDFNINNCGYMCKIITNLLLKYFIKKYNIKYNDIYIKFFNKTFNSYYDIWKEICLVIDINVCITNYYSYKLFYTWEDFEKIIIHFENNLIKKEYIDKQKNSDTCKDNHKIDDNLTNSDNSNNSNNFNNNNNSNITIPTPNNSEYSDNSDNNSNHSNHSNYSDNIDINTKIKTDISKDTINNTINNAIPITQEEKISFYKSNLRNNKSLNNPKNNHITITEPYKNHNRIDRIDRINKQRSNINRPKTPVINTSIFHDYITKNTNFIRPSESPRKNGSSHKSLNELHLVNKYASFESPI